MRNCLGCSAPLKLSLNACEFCGAEFADVDGGAAILPRDLTAEQLRGSVVEDESEFWRETVAALDSPFSTTAPAARARLREFEPSRWVSLARVPIESIFANLLLVRGEAFVEALRIGGYQFIWTNYRMVVAQGASLTVIPWHKLTSARAEAYDAGIANAGVRERLVIRWQSGDSERVLDTREGVLWAGGTFEALLQAKEWSSLTPLERELLSVSRRGLGRHASGFAVAPLRRCSTDADIIKWETALAAQSTASKGTSSTALNGVAFLVCFAAGLMPLLGIFLDGINTPGLLMFSGGAVGAALFGHKWWQGVKASQAPR